MQGKSRDLSDVIQFHAHQLPAQLSQSTNCSISKFDFSTFHHTFAFQSKHSLRPNVPCSVVNTYIQTLLLQNPVVQTLCDQGRFSLVAAASIRH